MLNKHLRRFLLERGLLWKFHRNIWFANPEPLRGYMDLRNDPRNAIVVAFPFEESAEGSEFWENVDVKWAIYYRLFNS